MSDRFAYKAVNAAGKTITGYMDAKTSDDVGTWLADRQYFVLEIKRAALSTITSNVRKKVTISRKTMNFFLLQLSSLINSGCPLLMSIRALGKQLPEGDLKNLLKSVKEKIEAGKSFSEALKTHKEVFSNLFITMVEVGEVGGILGKVLEQYASIHDAMYRIRAKVIKSMIYPAILLTSTLVVAWALLTYVFPVFIKRIQTNGHALPLPTQLVLTISSFLTHHSLTLVIIMFTIAALYKITRGTNKGDSFLANATLNLPVIGSLFKQVQLSLFSRILGTLLKCGVPILTSLLAVENALTNRVYKNAIHSVREMVSSGEPLSRGLSQFKNIFPESILLMIDVGERGGNIGEMLNRAGIIYERDLETTLETAVALIQPALIIFLSLFVTTLALAMYMPLFDIIKTVR